MIAAPRKYRRRHHSRRGTPLPIIVDVPDSFPKAAATDESSLRAALWELDIRNRITSVFLTAPDEDMYADVLDIVREALSSPYGIFGYTDDAGGLLCPSLTQDIWQECAVADKSIYFAADRHGPNFRQALSKGCTVVSNAPVAVPWGHVPVERVMLTPIRHAGEVIGLLVVANKPEDYSPEDQALLERIAAMVGPVLRARLQRDRQEAARRRAEAETRDSEDKFRSVVESSPMGVHMYRLEEDGRLVFTGANPAADRILGVDCRQFIGKTIEEAFPPLVHTEVPERYRHACISGEPWQTEQVDYEHGEIKGAYLVHAFRTAPGMMAALFLEVTERRRLEEQLLQARKMEAVGRLAGGVAHDFNNLLTVINGHSRMLLAKLDLRDPLRKGLEEIRKAGDRAAELTQQLLALSRKQVLHPQVLDLNHIVADMEGLVRGLLGPDVELHTSLEPALGTARADPVQLQQVLLNLAVNARDAMPAGGTLTIETRNVELAEGQPGAPAGLGPGRYVRLSVGDTGHGMDDETLRRVFEPFFTTKESGKGTGLGLATVYGIVQQSGGVIEVRSEPGQGTTFHLYLPSIGAPAAEVSAPEAMVDAGGSETILLVEDQAEVRAVATAVLAEKGYRVLEAASGAEALAWCDRYTGPIHLLLSDLVMPVMGGRQLAERVRALRPEVKVLYASGYPDEVIRPEEAGDGSPSFLPKPFTPEQLASKVRQVLGPPCPWGRILVVDDEPGVRHVLRSLLEAAGYEVVEAAHGGEALTLVRAGGIDLVLTDLVMPEQEGIETIRALRLESPEVRVIAMSGAFGGDFLRIAGLVGAHATIPKPLDPARLLGQVRAVLAR